MDVHVSPRAALALYRLARNFCHGWAVRFLPDWKEVPVAEDRERLADSAFASFYNHCGTWSRFELEMHMEMSIEGGETGWDPGLRPATEHRSSSGRYNWYMEDEVLHLWIERPFGVVAAARYYPETGEAIVEIFEGAEERHEEYLQELLFVVQARVTWTERVTAPAPRLGRRTASDPVVFDLLLAG
jgi:hypothetical protein